MIPFAAPLVLALGAILPQASPAPNAGDVYRPSLVVVELGDAAVADLQRLGLDIASVSPVGAELVCDARERALLESNRIPYRVVHEDLVAFYQSRLTNNPMAAPASRGSWLSPPFGQGSMGGFYTWSEIVSVLDQIAAAYPGITTAKFSIGTSIEGRDLWAIKLSDNPTVDESEPEARFDAMHHAREPESMQATIWALLALVEDYGTDPLATYLVNNREIWFIPCVNPDGYVYNQSTDPNGGGMWRKNRRHNGGGIYGVDPNRNYSYMWGYDDYGTSGDPSSNGYRGTGPASEPEVSSMEAFITARDFRTAISAHTYSDLLLYPWGYTSSPPPNAGDYQELSPLLTEVSGYPWGQGSTLLYPANGITIDYDQGEHGTLSWTVEIGGNGDGFWPPTSRIIPLAEENELMFLRTAQAAGAYIRTLTLDRSEVGDGDGYYEEGESVEFRYSIRNSGTSAPGTTVTLTLTSTSPHVTITTGSVSLGAVGPFSNANNNASPLAFTIDAGIPSGTTIPFTTAIEYEGHADATDGVIIAGEARPFLTDDVEVELGWTMGAPGDDASTGIWEWGNPVGTDYNGEDLNPENDATPAPGVNCYATGNGSTSAGGDDVDDGHTTLVTPRIDLSGVGGALLSFSRWYANLGSPQDDDFVIEISDDDGASWVSLETLYDTENSWTEVTFAVGEFVDQTSQVRLRFIAEDDPNNSLVEAGIDELAIQIFDDGPRVNAFGRPQIGTPMAIHMSGDSGSPWAIYHSPDTASIDLPYVDGTILIDPTTASHLVSGVVPADGLARTVLTLPTDPGLIGTTVYLQGMQVAGGIAVSNRAEVTFE